MWWFPYLFPTRSWFAKIGKPHQTVLLSIKCSFISVDRRTSQRLVLAQLLKDLRVEVVWTWRGLRVSLQFVFVPPMERVWIKVCCYFWVLLTVSATVACFHVNTGKLEASSPSQTWVTSCPVSTFRWPMWRAAYVPVHFSSSLWLLQTKIWSFSPVFCLSMMA